jgi:hypothetical protein
MLVTKHQVVREILTRFLFGHPERVPLRGRPRKPLAKEEAVGAPVR